MATKSNDITMPADFWTSYIYIYVYVHQGSFVYFHKFHQSSDSPVFETASAVSPRFNGDHECLRYLSSTFPAMDDIHLARERPSVRDNLSRGLYVRAVFPASTPAGER